MEKRIDKQLKHTFNSCYDGNLLGVIAFAQVVFGPHTKCVGGKRSKIGDYN